MQPRLNRLDIIALVVGTIIGWGAFTLPGTRFLTTSGVLDTAIGLAVGGVAIVFIQQGYAVMMHEHADEGGEFSYAYRHLGRGHAFVVGWSLVLAYISLVGLNGTAFVLVLKRIVGDGGSFGYLYTVAGSSVFASDVVVASLIMIAFAWLNIRGLRGTARMQNLLVLALVANVVVLFAAMVVLADTSQFATTYVAGWSVHWGRVASVVAIVPFLFVGFDVIPQVARDLDFPPERATRLAVTGIVAGVLLYMLLNVITALAFTPAQASGQQWATGAAVAEHLGPIGFTLLVVALAGAVMGGINGFTLASSKLIASLARHRFLPVTLLRTNDRHVFDRAVLAVLGISLLAPWAGREVVNYVVDMSSLLAAVAYAYTCFISTRVARTRPKGALSAVGLLCSTGFIALLLWPGSPGRLSGFAMVFLLVWVVLGAVVYRSTRTRIGPRSALDQGERVVVFGASSTQ